MRGNFFILANDLVEKGQKQKAVKVLDKAIKEFPNEKLHFDRYDIVLAECYLKAGEIKKGQDVLNKIITYYISYVKYLEQFKGKKAKSVEGEKLLSIYVLAELGELAQNYNLQTEITLAQSHPQVKEIMEYRRAGSLLNSYVAKLNQAISLLNSDKAQAENGILSVIDELNKNILSSSDENLISQTGQIFGFIYNTAYNNSLTKVQEALETNPKIKNLLNSLMAAQ
jgi:predicted Zn-dependent protease